jgi:uncharacterized protein (DUF697 family)
MKIADYVQHLFSRSRDDATLERRVRDLQQRAPVPVFWLFGKTQSGKTTIIKYLTGAEEAEIGAGFRPTTRFSRQYQFPTPDAPLLSFLDTRGVDEPGYDPQEDIARFDVLAHVVVVTVRVMDHAQDRILRDIGRIHAAKPERPIVLVLTCLHEASPQQQHPWPYAEDLCRSIAKQRERFRGLADVVVPIDLTKPEEGFTDPAYGGEHLKAVLVEVLPAAYRQTLLSVEAATRELRDWHERRALPYILSYSSVAATAGAIPVPWVDLFILPGIQTRMIYHLAQLYSQPLSGTRFLELASTLGLGMLVRQAIREVVKVLPGVGSVVSGTLAGSSTFALGKAFCYYYSAVFAGHVPRTAELKAYYQAQLHQAQQFWKTLQHKAKHPCTTGAGGS